MKPIAGIAGLCKDPNGEVIGDPYISHRSDLRERTYVHGIKGEHWGVVMTEVARRYPFPEVRGFIPEGYVWLEMARHYDDLCINEPLRIYHAGEPDALSRTKLSRGMVMYCRAMIRRDWPYAWRQPLRFLRAALASLLPL